MACFPIIISILVLFIAQLAHLGAGLGACRTRSLELNDGRGQALQISCGVYTESVLQELDLVISEAKKKKIRLILCLGPQNLRWPRKLYGDAFYTHAIINSDVKKQVKRVLTRINTFTGVAYRYDRAIIGWELISLQPHGGQVDPNCGKLTLSAGWIQGMASFVKSTDRNHLVTVDVEECGVSNMPQQKAINPRYQRRLLHHEYSLVVVSHVKAVPSSKPSGCTKIPTNEDGHCPHE